MIRSSLVRGLAIGQGFFYLGTGVWPLLSMCTFEKVTGPKTDDWLVKTVGVSRAATGTTLAVAGIRGRVAPERFLLGAASAAALGTVDVVYTAKGTSSSGPSRLRSLAPILVAAVLEGVLE